MSDAVLVDIVDRVATVTLNEPDKRNAISLAMVGGIAEAFDDLEADEEVGAIVVTGAPPAFCAGADLSHLGSSREDGLRRIYEAFLRLSRCPLPTLAAVNGAAVGAGLNMALSCDVRLAGEIARFDTRFLQLAIHPGGGSTGWGRRSGGVQAARAAGVFGEVLDGREAERVGLVWRCVAD
ncbi:MAG: enoyl-CoA hydratase-related protein, partial [Acidimicrobiales bacterium]